MIRSVGHPGAFEGLGLSLKLRISRPHGTAQVGIAQVVIAQVSAAEIDATEVTVAEVSPVEEDDRAIRGR